MSIIAANQVALPFESELVSALWLVTVSDGAKVTLGISHCVKLKKLSCIALLMTTEVQKPMMLLHNKKASFSFKNQYGTVQLPVVQKETTYLVGIVILPDPEPPSTGILSYFQPKALTCQYRYIVVYELLQQSETFSYNHWKVHILSFKNICGYSVS